MKATYRNMNESILPADDLKNKVFEKITRKSTVHFRPLTAVAAIMAVILLATPVMAAYVPPIAELMYQVSPEMAERFTPIQESCVKNGIKMEVVSASIHGSVAEIVVAFEDLEEDRIGVNFYPDFEVREYYSVFHALSSSFGVKGLSKDNSGYDPETGIKTYLLEQKFYGFSVSEILGNKITLIVDNADKSLEPVEIEAPLTLTDSEVMTVKVNRSENPTVPVEIPFDGGFGYGTNGDTDKEWNLREEYKLLTPGEAAYTVTEEISVMGAAYVDGRLHIQSRIQQMREAETTYDFWLEDRDGNVVTASCFNTFHIENGTERGDYKEFLFDIPEEELENYTLKFSVEQREKIKGPWKVTFAFTESDYVGEHDDGVPLETAPVYE